MAFGLLIHNDNGDIVVDGDYQNHIIAETGSATPPGTAGVVVNVADTTVNFSSTYAPSRQPLLFGRHTASYIGFQRWTYDGSGNINGFRYANREGGGTFNWKLAVTPNAASGDTWGMRVFGATGNVVFDSGLDYLKINDIITVTYTSFATGNQTHASTTTPFYCLSAAAAWGIIVLGANRSRAFAAYKAVDAVTAALHWVTPDLFGGGSAAGPAPQSAALLVAES